MARRRAERTVCFRLLFIIGLLAVTGAVIFGFFQLINNLELFLPDGAEEQGGDLIDSISSDFWAFWGIIAGTTTVTNTIIYTCFGCLVLIRQTKPKSEVHSNQGLVPVLHGNEENINNPSPSAEHLNSSHDEDNTQVEDINIIVPMNENENTKKKKKKKNSYIIHDSQNDNQGEELDDLDLDDLHPSTSSSLGASPSSIRGERSSSIGGGRDINNLMAKRGNPSRASIVTKRSNVSQISRVSKVSKASGGGGGGQTESSEGIGKRGGRQTMNLGEVSGTQSSQAASGSTRGTKDSEPAYLKVFASISKYIRLILPIVFGGIGFLWTAVVSSLVSLLIAGAYQITQAPTITLFEVGMWTIIQIIVYFIIASFVF